MITEYPNGIKHMPFPHYIETRTSWYGDNKIYIAKYYYWLRNTKNETKWKKNGVL